jgi:hypothetical protein
VSRISTVDTGGPAVKDFQGLPGQIDGFPQGEHLGHFAAKEVKDMRKYTKPVAKEITSGTILQMMV